MVHVKKMECDAKIWSSKNLGFCHIAGEFVAYNIKMFL